MELEEVVNGWLATLRQERGDATASDGKAALRIGPQIGRGGSGLVRLAYDPQLGRPVAIKTLFAGHNAEADQAKRFLAEARVTAQLDHPNIMPVYEMGTLAEGTPYYTMKLVQGRTLRQVLDELIEGGDQTTREFGRVKLLSVFAQVCAGVGFAHSKGVVHRDLKPANIMLGGHGEVLVMDWGISKVHGMLVERGAGAVETAHGEIFGTPAYLAPEQALGHVDEIDARTDVYSLGAILYEILTLVPPHTGSNPFEVLQKVTGWPVVPPRQRAPTHDIPEELEEICLRALARRREDRYGSASQLRRDVEAFLEGARSRQAADHHAALGGAEAGEYRRALVEARQIRAKAQEASSSVRAHDPVEAKRPVWELEQRAQEAETRAARSFAQAATALEQALAFSPGHRAARRQLAELYYHRYEQAEQSRNLGDAVYFRAQVEAYDDGSFSEPLRDEAMLSLQSTPPGAKVTLLRYEEDLGVRVARAVDAGGKTPLRDLRLPKGSYLAHLSCDGRLEARYPVHLVRGQSLAARVRLLRPEELEEGMVYVPAGPFLFGGDAQAPGALDGRVVEVPGFLIGRFPVTQGEYKKFVNDLAQRDAEEARRRVPRTETERHPYWVEREGQWEIPAVDGDGDPWDERMPVVGISYQDAEAFCEWLGERTGRDYRLPSEEEWEKAARGVDGRIFPWGDRFDATFCKMRASRPGRLRHEPVGAFAMDESPYSVRDLAGGVRDWVASDHEDDPDLRVVRGGGVGAAALTCRLGYRSAYQATDVSSYFGFRLARSV